MAVHTIVGLVDTVAAIGFAVAGMAAEEDIFAAADTVYMPVEPMAHQEVQVVAVGHTIVEIVHSLAVVAAYDFPSTLREHDSLMNAINGDETKDVE